MSSYIWVCRVDDLVDVSALDSEVSHYTPASEEREEQQEADDISAGSLGDGVVIRVMLVWLTVVLAFIILTTDKILSSKIIWLYLPRNHSQSWDHRPGPDHILAPCRSWDPASPADEEGESCSCWLSFPFYPGSSFDLLHCHSWRKKIVTDNTHYQVSTIETGMSSKSSMIHIEALSIFHLLISLC